MPPNAPSALDGDDVRLDLALDGASPKPLRDRLRRDIGRFGEPQRVSGLDLLPERSPFATVSIRGDAPNPVRTSRSIVKRS